MTDEFELSYQRYLKYLCELNYTYVEIDGELIDTKDIVPTRSEFARMVCIAKERHT